MANINALETKYDESLPLAHALADLYGFSPKNQNRIADLNRQAKTALGITTKAKTLPAGVRRSIWQWHADQLNELETKNPDEPTTEALNALETKGRGRPRKFQTDRQRMQAYRSEQKREGKRVELCLDFTTHRHIKTLARAWGCSLSAVVGRLVVELEMKYEGILYPESSTGLDG
jgi:hypothetical protein